MTDPLSPKTTTKKITVKTFSDILFEVSFIFKPSLFSWTEKNPEVFEGYVFVKYRLWYSWDYFSPFSNCSAWMDIF